LKVYEGKSIRKNKAKDKEGKKDFFSVNVSSKIEIFSNFSSTTKFIDPIKVETIQQDRKKHSGKIQP
jgi:hypothetical protein